MGILGINKLVAEQLAHASVSFEQMDKSITYNVIVDGNLALFSGCYGIDNERDIEENSNIVAYQSYDHLNTIFSVLKSKIKCNICIYFDGKRPKMKDVTSFIRQQNMSVNMDKNLALELFKQTLELNGYDIVQLSIGEAENEMSRSKKSNCIYITLDTDIYHIAYGQNAFVYKPKCGLFDMSKFKFAENLPNDVARLLCFMLGSDFTKPLITPSMFMAFVDNLDYIYTIDAVVKKHIDSLSNLIISENIEYTFSTIFAILNIFKKKYDICFHAPKNTGTETDCENTTKVYEWCLLYSKYGVQSPVYNIDYCEYTDIKKMEYYKHLIKKYKDIYVSPTSTMNSLLSKF